MTLPRIPTVTLSEMIKMNREQTAAARAVGRLNGHLGLEDAVDWDAAVASGVQVTREELETLSLEDTHRARVHGLLNDILGITE